MGNVPGYSAVQKFGRNDDIDAASGFEDIWAGGGTRAYLSSAETMDVVSDSTNDTNSAGTGMRQVTIEGLDSSFVEISETFNMNGTTAVTTSNSYLRVHRAFGTTVGSGGENAGLITIDPTTTGSGSRQASIAAGDGQTLLSHYTIPDGKTGYIVGGQCSVAPQTGTTGTKQASVQLMFRMEDECWRLQGQYDARSTGTSISSDLNFAAPFPYPEHSDLRWRADAENNNTAVYVQYNIILVDN